MKYLLWITLCISLGVVLGFAIPFGICWAIVLEQGPAANGIGTACAAMMVLTIPSGILLGAYTGVYRARNGKWKGVFSGAQRPGEMNLVKILALKQQFSDFDRRLEQLSLNEANEAKQTYLLNMTDDYESTKFNFQSFGLSVALSLMFPPLLVVPLLQVGRYYSIKAAIRNHIHFVVSRWDAQQSGSTGVSS